VNRIVGTAHLAAFACYAAASLLAMAFGAVYLLRSSYLPYHAEALGKPWSELEPRLQALILGLMRATGGGMLGGGVSAAILLVIPFRAGESWSVWALPVVGFVTVLPTLYATLLVRSRTGAHAPVWASLAGIGLIAIGLILSLL
jgi:hypothetical protein